ncbi:MAG: serine hydrolase domain-containing protein, partial [Pseudomonadota bacterium]
MRAYRQPVSSRATKKSIALLGLIAFSLAGSNAYAGTAAVAATTATSALPGVKSLAGQCEAILQGMSATGPGTVVLAARKGELICTSARGMADMELGLALKLEQKFRIGSITKQFTAVALLKLVDQDKARLDDPLSKYLSDFPGAGKITLLQLLNHTAGVGDLTGAPNFAETTQRIDTTSKDLVKLISALPADFAPGTS